jgi:hypothetical protein
MIGWSLSVIRRSRLRNHLKEVFTFSTFTSEIDSFAFYALWLVGSLLFLLVYVLNFFPLQVTKTPSIQHLQTLLQNTNDTDDVLQFREETDIASEEEYQHILKHTFGIDSLADPDLKHLKLWGY